MYISSQVATENELRSAKPTTEDAKRHQEAIYLGSIVVLPRCRALLRDNDPIGLGARAFDLLLVLLKSRGEVVSKEAIFAYVWPTTTVDESNLRFQMTVLRRALGEERALIKTIPGRGYLLVAELGLPLQESRANFARLAHDDESQRELRNALCTLLRLAGRYPGAIASLEETILADLSFLATDYPVTAISV